MVRKSIVIISMILLSTVIGCASNQLKITFYSDPSGATIYQGEKVFGYAPVTVNVSVRPEDQELSVIKLLGIKAIWASGVSRSIEYISLDRDKGSAFKYIFARPDVTGRDIDVNFALQLERNQIMRMQAEAQQSQAALQMYNTMLNQYRQSYVPTYTPISKPLSCTSRRIGNNVYTDCY